MYNSRVEFYHVDINKTVSKDTRNIMTDVAGVELNSLYPSVYNSIKSNKIPYTKGRLLIPGDFKKYILGRR
jgi:hypothetical protein